MTLAIATSGTVNPSKTGCWYELLLTYNEEYDKLVQPDAG